MTIKYFGQLIDFTGKNSETLHLQSANLGQVLLFINNKYATEHIDYKIAVNREIIDKNSNIIVTENDEIALLPAYSGG